MGRSLKSKGSVPFVTLLVALSPAGDPRWTFCGWWGSRMPGVQSGLLERTRLWAEFARRIVVRAIWADLLWSARFVN